MNWDGHTFLVSLAAEMYVATLLPSDLKARALKGTYCLSTLNTRKFVTHAARGIESRAMKNGSGSFGTGSPSSRNPSM